MVRRLVAVLAVCFLVLPGCTSPAPSTQSTTNTVERPATLTPLPPPSATPPPTSTTAQATVVQSEPTSAPTNTPASAPPSDSAPRFSAYITFAPVPDPARDIRSFSSGVTEIYAMWEYSGISADDIILREWYLDGALWIEREEPWDFTTYGTSGMVRDISIYDYDEGLPPGEYELRLYINGEPQFPTTSDPEVRSFTIMAPAAANLPSPDGALVAFVEGQNKLVVEDTEGQRIMEIFDEANPNVTEIAGFDWLPIGHYLVYSIKYPHPDGIPVPSYALWIVHIDSGTYYEISEQDERLHHPVVSPDGRYIAVIQGSGYGDACVVDRRVAVVELHTAAVQRVALFELGEFNGLPSPTDSDPSTAYSVDAEGLPLPGVWESSTRFRTALRWLCVEQADAPDGIYELELNELNMQKVGDLPAQDN